MGNYSFRKVTDDGKEHFEVGGTLVEINKVVHSQIMFYLPLSPSHLQYSNCTSGPGAPFPPRGCSFG